MDLRSGHGWLVTDEGTKAPLENFQIQNRRYLGNKYRLLPHLEGLMEEKCCEVRTFCDLFAGTGVVAHRFNRPETKVIANDLLYSNYISLYAWLSPEPFEESKLRDILVFFNSLEPSGENYVSRHFGGRFFTVENAVKIGYLRSVIEDMERASEINFREKAILLTSLLYAMDKVANTCGHYDAFRKKLDTLDDLELRFPDIQQENNVENEIYCLDANQLISRIDCDLLYLDPPYNSRQYSDTYHLLENIITWKQPPVFGIASKMPRRGLKSKYCLKEASGTFEDLVSRAKTRYLVVSYNNMGSRGDLRSNARISDEELVRILSRRGRLEYHEFDYKAFSAGRNNTMEGHTERLFFVEVEDHG